MPAATAGSPIVEASAKALKTVADGLQQRRVASGSRGGHTVPMRTPLLLALVVGVVGLAACDSPAQICTLEARASVNVVVQNEAGDTIDDATVTFRIDDGDDAPCASGANRDTWACGYERAGDFTITVARDGFETQERAITVGQDDDGCHVAARSITVTLLPSI